MILRVKQRAVVIALVYVRYIDVGWHHKADTCPFDDGAEALLQAEGVLLPTRCMRAGEPSVQRDILLARRDLNCRLLPAP
ncbi:MAG: hypothetical protein ACI9A1_000361 [Lentimonas sp.]|jgi:hypothetical protein